MRGLYEMARCQWTMLKFLHGAVAGAVMSTLPRGLYYEFDSDPDGQCRGLGCKKKVNEAGLGGG